jgi:cell wall assembly regulator SMI1
MRVETPFEKLLATLAPYQKGASFPPPATDSALRALEAYVGRSLPDQLVAMWKICDGGPFIARDRLSECLFYTYMFMSVSQVLEHCQSMREILMPQNMPDLDEPIPSFPDGAVQGDLYSASWLAFAHDFAGGHLAIDFAPGPNGVVGQVINYGRDDRAHFQLSSSVDAFLERVICDYENKRLHHVFGEQLMYVDRLLLTQQQQGGRVCFSYSD